MLLVERAAAPLLGIKGYGVHMNGYVCKDDSLYLWVATRSTSKPTWPEHLDHIAAGGQVLLLDSSCSVADCAVTQCATGTHTQLVQECTLNALRNSTTHMCK